MDTPRVPACHTSLLAVLCYVSLSVASVCAAPFEPFTSSRRDIEDKQLRQARQAADVAEYPDTLTGKLIPYNWGFGAVTDDLSADAARYEDELSALLDGQSSEWQVLPREAYTYQARPIVIDGVQDVVARVTCQYSTPGGRAFFEHLMSDEGHRLLDGASHDASTIEKSREASKTVVGPNYATVYPIAAATSLPAPSAVPALIYEGAVHWQMCDANELTAYRYPARTAVEDRMPRLQELSASLHILVTGKAPEYTLVNAVRVRQVDSQMIEIQHVLWNSLSHGSPASAVLHGVEEFYLAVDRRMRKHLEETAYPVETGNECDTELVEGGFGVMGDIETLMSVIEHSSEQ